MERKQCLNCGSEFETYKKLQKFCSLQCSSKAQKKNNYIKKICENCKNEFEFQASPSKIERRKFCSQECLWKSRRTVFEWDNFICKSNESYIEIKQTGNYHTNHLGTRSLQHTTKNNFDHEFFANSVNSEQTAYVLGLIMSDGSVFERVQQNGSKVYGFTLELTDFQIIKDVSKMFNYNNKIHTHKRVNKEKTKTTTSYRIIMTSYKLYQDLNNLGCTVNKTYTLKYPKIDKEFDKHFIRGIIDGDGSFYIKDNQLLLSIVGTDFICRAISEIIFKNLEVEPQSCIYPSKYDNKTKMDNFCHVRWNYKDTLKIHKWIYDDASIYLKRKKYKINKLKSVYTDQISTSDLAKICNVSNDYIKRHFDKVGAGSRTGRYRTFNDKDVYVWKDYILKNKKK